MKTIKAQLATLASLFAVAPLTLTAQTIIVGGEGSLDYIGDFTGESMTHVASTTGTTQDEINDGWIGTRDSATPPQLFWEIAAVSSDDRGQRTTGNPNSVLGMGITFDSDFSGTYTLSFDYGSSDTNGLMNRLPHWGFMGYSSSDVTDTWAFKISENTLALSQSEATAEGLTWLAGAELPLNTESSVSTSVTLDSSAYQGYIFFYNTRGNEVTTGVQPYIDNVAITIPEPSSAVLLLGSLGAIALVCRRRF